MAIYTTLFSATDTELTEYIPEWRLPLASPQQVTRKNPFSGQDVSVTTWDPGSASSLDQLPSLYQQKGRAFLAPAMAPDGEFQDYQQWLEENCPAILRTLPHVAMKGITHFELQELGAVLVGDVVPPARFLDCPEDEGCIGAIQADAIPLLANASEHQLRDVSAKWCTRLEEGDANDMLWVLLRVRALARDAVARQGNLFSFTAS